MIRSKLFFSILILLIATIQPIQAQSSFSRTFGGERDEKAMTAMETRAGAYVVAGLTFSYGKGKSDIWVLKLDPEGREIWRKYLGSDDFDWANDIIETREGNYVIAGYSQDPETSWIEMEGSFGPIPMEVPREMKPRVLFKPEMEVLLSQACPIHIAEVRVICGC